MRKDAICLMCNWYLMCRRFGIGFAHQLCAVHLLVNLLPPAGKSRSKHHTRKGEKQREKSRLNLWCGYKAHLLCIILSLARKIFFLRYIVELKCTLNISTWNIHDRWEKKKKLLRTLDANLNLPRNIWKIYARPGFVLCREKCFFALLHEIIFSLAPVCSKFADSLLKRKSYEWK